MIEEIKNQTICEEFKGGVVDHGDFLEGFCFQIKTFSEKKKTDIIWEVCGESRVKIFK
jgi:hypothetical protein